MNHFANGSSHSSVLSKGFVQLIRSRARLAQNASKSASASAYRSSVALAWAAKAGSGGKSRDSARRFSISGGGSGCSTLTGPSFRSLSGRAIVPRPTHLARPRRGAIDATRIASR